MAAPTLQAANDAKGGLVRKPGGFVSTVHSRWTEGAILCTPHVR